MKMSLRSGHTLRPLPSTAAATVANGVLTTGFLRRKFSCWPKRSVQSVALQVDGISWKSNCSWSSKCNYLEQSSELLELEDGGPPRWLSPLDCGGCRSPDSPLLLFLPGNDGVGLGLMLHHKRLGEIFDVWCLHIPTADRTPLPDLVKLVQSTVQTEHKRAPKKPIYLVGESFGASLALVAAAKNPDIDLVLILANPATNFSKSLVRSVMRLFGKIRNLFNPAVLWKLKMIDEMQNHLNSHIHVVKAQTLILLSGKILTLLSGLGEGKKIRSMLDRCWIRSCIGHRNPLFSDGTFDLVIGIIRECYYRRGASIDYVSDFLPPTPSEFKKTYKLLIRLVDLVVSPVMFSTVGGKVVRGFAGIPSEGPIIFVGCHMLYGIDAVPIFLKFMVEQNTAVRGMGHPLNFGRLKYGKGLSLSLFDIVRITGGVPVTGTNLYGLLSQKAHVLLYPGGVREALHRKGEEYKLIWPDEPEFVRMAARFGAKIIPFGAVGEDDVLHLILDCDEQMKIPPLRALIEELSTESVGIRSDVEGEIGKQILYYPIFLPKLPGRFYYLFGEPISTEGRDDLLRSKDKAREMYLEVKTKIEKNTAYLKEKRENDPYRNLLARLVYQARHGFSSQVPTFDI